MPPRSPPRAPHPRTAISRCVPRSPHARRPDAPQVLGITHPAAATRDVALFVPFRAALRKPTQTVGLPTLVHHLMRRQIQMGRLDSVRPPAPPAPPPPHPPAQLENARAALDLYRSHGASW